MFQSRTKKVTRESRVSLSYMYLIEINGHFIDRLYYSTSNEDGGPIPTQPYYLQFFYLVYLSAD